MVHNVEVGRHPLRQSLFVSISGWRKPLWLHFWERVVPPIRQSSSMHSRTRSQVCFQGQSRLFGSSGCQRRLGLRRQLLFTTSTSAWCVDVRTLESELPRQLFQKFGPLSIQGNLARTNCRSHTSGDSWALRHKQVQMRSIFFSRKFKSRARCSGKRVKHGSSNRRSAFGIHLGVQWADCCCRADP